MLMTLQMLRISTAIELLVPVVGMELSLIERIMGCSTVPSTICECESGFLDPRVQRIKT